jgi:hypothetical protein
MTKFIITDHSNYGWWIGRSREDDFISDYLLRNGKLSANFNDNYSQKLIDCLSILFKHFNVILSDPKKPENQRLLRRYVLPSRQCLIFDEI